MIQDNFNENVLLFLELTAPISAFLYGCFKAIDVLKSQESVELFIMGDLEDE